MKHVNFAKRGSKMRQPHGKNDYYEARPFLFFLASIFGLIAPLISHPDKTFFKISYLSSFVILACTYKIIQMRKAYRRRRLPL